MNGNSTILRKAVSRREIRSTSKLLLSAAALVFVLYLATLLPGVDRLVPRTPVTFAAVVGAIATLAVVVLLLYTAPKVASLVRLTVEGPRAVVENLASIVHWVVVLAAVLVAHRGLAGITTPLFDGIVWIYDAVFLLIALPVLAVIAARVYVSLDPGADLIADVVVGAEEKDANAPTDDVNAVSTDGRGECGQR